MTFTFLQRDLRSHVKGKIWETVCMDLNITPPHLGRTASPSLGVGTTSPGGACAHTHTPTHCHINISTSFNLVFLILVPLR